jgi:hypothetical protein
MINKSNGLVDCPQFFISQQDKRIGQFQSSATMRSQINIFSFLEIIGSTINLDERNGNYPF